MLISWARGGQLGRRGQGYQAILEFPQACGISVGTPVRIRGVPVGGVLLVNYRGYGDSQGRPSAAALRDDALLILDELAAADQRLRVEHVFELPPGWLGKNHALQLGARRATGKLILFTDADVLFEPTVLSRAADTKLRCVGMRIRVGELFDREHGWLLA